MDDEKENFIKKIPGLEAESIELLPSIYRNKIIKNTNSFFVEHRVLKDALDRCSFEQAFLHFGESQQSKGRALESIDDAHRQKLISTETSNALVSYIHLFNDAKMSDLLTGIKDCILKDEQLLAR